MEPVIQQSEVVAVWSYPSSYFAISVDLSTDNAICARSVRALQSSRYIIITKGHHMKVISYIIIIIIITILLMYY